MSTEAVTPDPADSPDVVLPTEDDDPESLAGDPVEFDPDAPDDDTGDSAEGQQPAGT